MTAATEGVAVCDVCGLDEHTPEELARCLDEVLAPVVPDCDCRDCRAEVKW